MDPSVAEVQRELVRRRADLVPHARGSLLDHLTGVAAIVEAWGQPARVQRAALLHSAYSTESFRYRLFGRGERARVRELVGEEAERLCFLFCACRRSAILAAAPPVKMPTRWGGAEVAIDGRARADLLLLHAANLAEQAARPRGSPARWLATATRLWVVAKADAEIVPGPFVAITPENESRLLRAYRGSLRRVEPGAGEILARSPVGEPLFALGLHALARAEAADARRFFAEARDAFARWAVAWDKRLRIARWQEMTELLAGDAARAEGEELERAAQRAQDAVARAAGSPARLWALLDGARPFAIPPAHDASVSQVDQAGTLPARFADYIAGLRTNAERPLLNFYPGLRAEPWHDPRAFPIVADLERLAPQIAEEAKAFDPARFQDEAENIGRQGKWGVLFLLEMGRRNEENLARSPTLRALLEAHRTLTTHAGLMYFSSLDPGSRVAAHYGPTNVRLRCHLGLEVPDGCGIRVGGVTRQWEEGRCLVFDDSFRHDVWNESDRRRVVLILDLWHPDLSEDEIALLAGLHRYGAANAPSAERYWARNDAALRRARAASATKDGALDEARALDALTSEAMRAGDLRLAGERAVRYAALCRGTRWYPFRRESDPVLPADVPWSPVLTPGKLLHDIDQLEYLRARGIVGDDIGEVIRQYDGLVDTLRPLGENARVPLAGAARAQVGHVYNRLVHVRETPRVARALSSVWDQERVEADYLARKPSCVTVDGFLSEEALASLRAFCLESTVWSTNRYDHGRLGSFFRDGFNSPLLIQIAEEIRTAFPRVIGALPVTQMWGYKYATTQPALAPHADFAAVNVNFWITPDEANLDPEGGGLVVYDVDAPADWDFATYNRDARRIRALLEERSAREIRIPYRCNRAVIFDSDLFHATPELRFRPGYENRRVNVTVLFGDRSARGASER